MTRLERDDAGNLFVADRSNSRVQKYHRWTLREWVRFLSRITQK